MGETGDTALTRGDRTQGIGYFLQGGDIGKYTVWVGDMGHFNDNGEKGRGDIDRVPLSDHGEASKAANIWDIGDAWGRRRTRGSGNTVGRDLHRKTSGNLGSVGGATFSIRGVCERDT